MKQLLKTKKDIKKTIGASFIAIAFLLSAFALMATPVTAYSDDGGGAGGAVPATCLTPDSLGDNINFDEDLSGLQSYINAYPGQVDLSGIDVDGGDNQTNFQIWNFNSNANFLTLEFEFITFDSAAYTNVFGYYLNNSGTLEFTPLFQHTKDYDTHPDHDVPDVEPEYNDTFTIDASEGDYLGFAIDSYDGTNDPHQFYSEMRENEGQWDRTLVYNITPASEEEDDSIEEWLVCFEDKRDPSDMDYNDMVVIIRLKDCCEDESPTMESISESEDEYYKIPPTFTNFGFDDNYDLDYATYKINSGAETYLFGPDFDGSEWNNDGWSLSGDFDSLDDGYHTITFYVVDDCGNSNQYSWSFYKDTTGPVQTIDFGTPKDDNYFFVGGDIEPYLTGIGALTPVWVNSTDEGIGSKELHVQLFVKNIDGTGMDLVWEKTITNDGSDDSETEVEGKISYKFFIQDSCRHEVDFWCYDELDNRMPPASITEDVHAKEFLVDADPPVIPDGLQIFQGPVVDGDPVWITPYTIKYINATDQGCPPPYGSGVEYLEYEVLNATYDENSGTWTYTSWFSGTVLDGGSDDGDGTNDGNISFALTIPGECRHRIIHKAYDEFGNVNSLHYKELVRVDGTPPNITKIVGDPNCSHLDSECGCLADGDYCVEMSTDITISAVDEGCEGGVGMHDTEPLQYRVWNGTWDNWVTIANGDTIHPFEEECKHYLEIKAKDKLGNTIVDNETFYVDETPPHITKLVGDPNVSGDGMPDYWVTMGTGITADVYDLPLNCCPCDVSVYYKVWNITDGDDNDDVNWEVWPDPTTEITPFDGNCEHGLSIKAVDCLGHVNYDNETFYVDDNPPTSTKEVGQPNCTGCDLESDDYCINSTTPIWINASDNELPCDIGEYTIHWKIWNVTGDSLYNEGIQHNQDVILYIDETCEHNVSYWVNDTLGNRWPTEDEGWHEETFYVDNNPPIIQKVVGDPNCSGVCGADYCVKTHTPIYIRAGEESCCPCDITFEYRVHNGTYDSGWKSVSTNDNNITDGGDGWFSFSFDSECFHHFDLRATDCLGQVTYHNETFFVDDTPPQIDKTVHDPNIPGDFYWAMYTEATCPNCGWPSDSSEVYFPADWDTWTATNTYLDHVGAATENWDTSDFSTQDKFDVDMTRETVGDKVRWTVDISGMSEDPTEGPAVQLLIADENNPLFIVGVNSFESETPFYKPYDDGWKDIESLPDGVTMVGENGDYHFVIEIPVSMLTTPDYWVSCDTDIEVDVSDGGCCDNLADVWVNYSYDGVWYEKYHITDPGSFPVIVNFDENCSHILNITARDCLGNTVSDVETFYVDCDAPELVKTVGQPNCSDDLDDGDYCVTTDTEITLDYINHECCQSEVTIEYRIWNETDGWDDWQIYVPGNPITFDEECMHYLEAKVYDALGNSNECVDNETFFVDDTPPQIDKTVHDPNIPGDFYWAMYTEATCPNCGWPSDSSEVYFPADWDTWTATNTYLDHVGAATENWDTSDFSTQDKFDVDMTRETVGDKVRWTVDISGMSEDPTEGPAVQLLIADENNPLFIVGVNSFESETPFYKPYDDGWKDIESLPDGVTMVGENGDYHFVIEIPVSMLTTPDYWVSCDTDIEVDVSDGGCCDNLADVWVNYSYDGVWYEKYHITDPGSFPVIVNFDENCSHILNITARDCLGNTVSDVETFYVDCNKPEIEKIVGNPSIEDPDDPGTYWVTDYTPINLSASDEEIFCDSGIKDLKYQIEYPAGVWTDLIDYTGNFTFNEGCVHNLSVKAIDNVGNVRWHNETFIVHGEQSGGSDQSPQVEISHPTGLEGPICEEKITVTINAEDDETENLDVSLWIPGGRRDAPRQTFEVNHEGENTYTSEVPINEYQDGAQLTLWAAAKDEDDNVAFALPVDFTVCSTTIYDTWFQKGWNKLELPFNIGCNTTVDRILDSIDGKYDRIYHRVIDPTSPYFEDEWISYSVNAIEDGYAGGELLNFEDGLVYWVHITSETPVHYYLSFPEISIEDPTSGECFTEMDSISGETWDSQGGIQQVSLVIKNEENGKYWNESEQIWDDEQVFLSCQLTTDNYHQTWTFDTSNIWWMCGEYSITARAEDNYDCFSYDSINVEPCCHTISGTIYTGDTGSGEVDMMVLLFNEEPSEDVDPIDYYIPGPAILPEDYVFDVPVGNYYVGAAIFEEGQTPGEEVYPLYCGWADNTSSYDPSSADEISVVNADVPNQNITLYSWQMPADGEGE